MTILCDTDLLTLMRGGLIAEPDYALINPASIDIRVGEKIILENDNGMENHIVLPPEGRHIWPGQLVLVETFESFSVPNGYAMDLRLKSTTARRGWNHQLAFWVDPGWQGKLTMEIQNTLQLGPLLLIPGQRFAQVIIHRLSAPAAKPYAGKYQGSQAVTAAKD